MKIFRELTVCEHCDSVYRKIALMRHERAICDTCGAVLYRARNTDVDHLLALTLTAAVCFMLANAFPVIRISMQGATNEATLWQSFMALGHGGAAPIAIPALLTVIIVPGLQIALLAWVLGFARLGQRAPGFAAAMHGLRLLRPWSMVEVCLLSALVAIIKLAGHLSVIPGTGIYATAALTLLLVMLAKRDLHWLWDLADELAPARTMPGTRAPR